MGMAAPGFNAELWAEGVPAVSPTPPKGADDDADPWRSALPCADGTVCLVLGAGNQSFLSLVEVLGRCLLDGDAVLLKHHPLRPWLAPPYAALLAPTLLPPLPCRWLYPSMWCLCPPSSIAGTARCSRRSRGAASSPRPSTRASRVRTAARTLPFTTPHRHSPPASVNASPSRPLPHNLIVRPWFVSRTRHDGAADRPARRPRLPHRLRGDRDRRARHTRRRGAPAARGGAVGRARLRDAGARGGRRLDGGGAAERRCAAPAACRAAALPRQSRGLQTPGTGANWPPGTAVSAALTRSLTPRPHATDPPPPSSCAAVTIAAGKKANGGCNCLSPQSVLLPRGWAHPHGQSGRLGGPQPGTMGSSDCIRRLGAGLLTREAGPSVSDPTERP